MLTSYVRRRENQRVTRALYIHWPFCIKKCPYCDFNSHVRASVDTQAWREALLADMRAEAAVAGGKTLTSIFFGGGTPSLMPPSLVADLLAEAERLWGFDPDIEITLEANPSSVEAAKFSALAAAGINRVSLGVQSLEDETLLWLGRLHGAQEALMALEIAQSSFDRVSFDLIYALPDQTPEQWERQLSTALSFGTSHLSLYQLTIEPGTRFETDVRLGRFEPLDDDRAADLYDLTRRLTQKSGLPAYETSNHAKPGEESRHNLTYWRYQDYAGIGPGAHGRRLHQGGGFATVRHKKPENFLKAVKDRGHGIAEQTLLTPNDQVTEALLMGLRLTEGIDLAGFEQRFERARQTMINPKSLATYTDLGFVWQRGSRIGVEPKGAAVLNTLIEALVVDDLVQA